MTDENLAKNHRTHLWLSQQKTRGSKKVHEWFRTQEIHRSKKKVLSSFRVGWLYGQILDSRRNPYFGKRRPNIMGRKILILFISLIYILIEVLPIRGKKLNVKSFAMHFLTNTVAILITNTM